MSIVSEHLRLHKTCSLQFLLNLEYGTKYSRMDQVKFAHILITMLRSYWWILMHTKCKIAKY